MQQKSYRTTEKISNRTSFDKFLKHLLTLHYPSLRSQNGQKSRRLGELNAQWETQYNHKITSVLPTMAPECNLARKQTRVEIKKKIASHVTEQMKENATLIHLHIVGSGMQCHMRSDQQKKPEISFTHPKSNMGQASSNSTPKSTPSTREN